MQRKEKEKERQIVFYDEESEITDDVWNILEKKLRKDN
jgi:hypothetical protein